MKDKVVQVEGKIREIFETLRKEPASSRQFSNVSCTRTPHYWKIYPNVNDAGLHLLTSAYEKVPIDLTKTVALCIVKLINETWRRNTIGLGNDACGLRHTDIKVKSINRIENPSLFLKYIQSLNHLSAAKNRHDVSQFRSTKEMFHRPLTMECGESLLTKPCRSAANEVFLFHGTKPENVQAIIARGLDCRLAKSAMFGSGIYFCESSTKADQYAGIK